MKKINVLAITVLFIWLTLAIPGSAVLFGAETMQVPVKGKVTMVDLGAKKCIPCKMMAPILERMEKRYAGKAAIIFLDVWQDPKPAHHFGIRTIPTQIFFDKKGKEVYRHMGFMSEEDIVAQLQSMGVK
jgi:thioredoxin 1